MGFFPKDLEDGKAAEKVAMAFIEDKWSEFSPELKELDKSEQHLGDIHCSYTVDNDSKEFTAEVKYDRMAAKTGNLCFEISNGRGDLTGVASTKAKVIIYLVHSEDNNLTVFVFNSDKLRAYLYDDTNSDKVRTVQGGDRKAYTLLLVSMENIRKDNVAVLVEDIHASI